ncbi:two-component sensor histidine kinase [plant metagenome]|uniref:Two-component sensor histidine kinase n=1 Tax=plant metagenome TaxID=1297885 RepID=A0A484T5F3_9ZZZZ
MRTWLLALLVLAAEMVLLVWDPALPPETAPGVQTLTQAEFVLGDAREPPETGWQVVSLPDSWRARRPQAKGVAWYRIRFDLDAVPDAPKALYLPRVAIAGEVWLNGSLLNVRLPDGAPGGRELRFNDQPLYFELPSRMFRAGHNEILVRLLGDPGVRSGLSAPRLGPAPVVSAMMMPQRLLSTAMPYVLGILMLSAMALACAYAYRRRQYLDIPMTVAFAAIALILDLVHDLPFTRSEVGVLRVVAVAAGLSCLCHVAYRLSVLRRPRLPRWIVAVALLVIGFVLATIPLGLATDLVSLLLMPFYVLVAYVLALLLQTAWLQRSLRMLLLALTALVWAATFVHASILALDVTHWDAFRYNTAAGVPLCALMVLILAERFVQDRDAALRSRGEAVDAERARILQDMHDGMGAQLITAKRLALRQDVDRGELALVIDESLQDLRLIIDSLDVSGGDVLPLLGNLRFRLAPRLAALGIRLSWNAEAMPPLAGLNAGGALSILRIVQEAINNALKHAQPGHLHIEIGQDGAALRIQVQDDGKGFDAAVAAEGGGGTGRGLTGMRLRAERLGGSVAVDSAPARGTRVTLRVPPQQAP